MGRSFFARVWPTVVVVFVVALSVRGLVLYELRDSPIIDLMIGDAAGYQAWAREIVSGGAVEHQVFFQAPLYPYFLSYVHRFLWSDGQTIRMVQIVIGSFSCLFLALAARFLVSPRAGLVAGLLLAIYPTAIFFDCLIQKTVLGMFWICLILLLIPLTRGRRSTAWSFLLGVVCGLLALTRENALVLVPILLLWLLISRWGTGFVERARGPVVFVFGLMMVLLPVSMRNYGIDGSLTLTTSQFGPNFYIGNNERAEGIYMPLKRYGGDPTHERLDAVEIAETAMGCSLTASEVSAWWTAKSFAFIRSEPWAWLRLMVRKVLLVINGDEVSDAEDRSIYERWSLVLRILRFFSFSVLFALSLAGMCLSGNRVKHRGLLMILCLALAGSVVMFFIFERYRFSFVPILVLFAASLVTMVPADFREQSRIRCAVCLGVSLLGFGISRIDLVDTRATSAAAMFNIGANLLERGEAEAAKSWLMESLELEPMNDSAPVALLELGVIASQKKDYAAAERYFRESLALDADHVDSLQRLGELLLVQNRIEEAHGIFLRVLELEPCTAAASVNLGVLAIRDGDMAAARRRFDDALACDADNSDALYNGALLAMQSNEFESAESLLRRFIEGSPGNVEGMINLGVVLARQERYDAAREIFEDVVKHNPDRDDARHYLDRVQEKLKRVDPRNPLQYNGIDEATPEN